MSNPSLNILKLHPYTEKGKIAEEKKQTLSSSLPERLLPSQYYDEGLRIKDKASKEKKFLGNPLIFLPSFHSTRKMVGKKKVCQKKADVEIQPQNSKNTFWEASFSLSKFITSFPNKNHLPFLILFLFPFFQSVLLSHKFP